MLAMFADAAVTVGTDSLSMLVKFTRLAQHAIMRKTAKLRESDGKLNLGGELSWLHRDRPVRQRWKCTKDGDLWGHTQKMIEAKGPESTKMVKVKGHATSQMVKEGKVRAEDKLGNDKAGQAACKGTKDERRRLYAMTDLFAERHGAYKKFTSRIHNFLIHMQKAVKEAWQSKEKEAYPMQPLEGKKKGQENKGSDSIKVS